MCTEGGVRDVRRLRRRTVIEDAGNAGFIELRLPRVVGNVANAAEQRRQPDEAHSLAAFAVPPGESFEQVVRTMTVRHKACQASF